MGAECSKSQNYKNQRVCLLAIDWLVNTIDHFYPILLLVMRNGVFMPT